MKISIAMTTYNGEKFLFEQLESLMKQTVLPDELVITDDGSTDNTIEIINKFKEVAAFEIRIYSNEENLGYTQNFNKAMQLCTNDFIFLSDQDDVWLPNKIEYMIGLADLHQSKDAFMIDAELVDKDLKTSGLTKQGQIKNLGLSENAFVMGCCIAVRKTFLDIILPIPKDFTGHDSWIVGLADFLQLRVMDDTVLQLYRRHGNNESNAIYNSLVKVNKYSVNRLIKKYIPLFKHSKKDSLEKSIQKKELLLIGVNRLYHYSDYEEKTKINIIRENSKEDIRKIRKRLEIIQTKRIMSRTLKAWSPYKNGDYTFKVFISDLIFD